MRLLLFISILIFAGCSDPEREAIILDELIEKGVTAYKFKKKSECHQEILVEADRLVDSIFLSKAFYTKQDTFKKPLKPTRPLDPILRDARDDRSVGPLFDSLGEE